MRVRGKYCSILAVVAIVAMTAGTVCFAQTTTPKFRVMILTEHGGLHEPFVAAATAWLNDLARKNNFAIDEYNHAKEINEDVLAKYKLIIQLNYPPYTWSDEAMAAFTKYIEEGKGGGWIGFHHATLLGEFDGYPMWNWFSDFMGGIRYDNYIATLVSGKVIVEDTRHPVMKGVPPSFLVTNEEFYTYNKSPRPNVHVLAHVDESSYEPASDIKMGDHPVVWTNDRMKARNLYIFMGHHPDLLKNEAYTTLFGNAIFWAAGQDK